MSVEGAGWGGGGGGGVLVGWGGVGFVWGVGWVRVVPFLNNNRRQLIITQDCEMTAKGLILICLRWEH